MTINTLKSRDCPKPCAFTAEGDLFKLQAGSQAAWLTGATFSHKELRNRIEPWLMSLFQSEHLPEQHRPKSDDPDFWAVWSGQGGKGQTVERPVNWKSIADDWQQSGASAQLQALENNDE